MAAAPTTAELMAMMSQLQAQIVAFQNAAPAAAAAPPAGAASVVLANITQMLGTDDLIDFSTKQGSAIFKQGCKALDNKALTNGFAMTLLDKSVSHKLPAVKDYVTYIMNGNPPRHNFYNEE
jgi:hypothetical protein